MEHWFLAGSSPQDYETGIDQTDTYNGKRIAFIKAIVPQPEGMGTLMQRFKADAYHGKRLRLAAAVKTQDVSKRAGLWLRIDGPRPGYSFLLDNMRDRPITGTTGWQQYEVVLDVAGDSSAISFGLYLKGSGQAWFSDLRFEEMDNTVLVTASPRAQTVADGPRNLDFGES